MSDGAKEIRPFPYEELRGKNPLKLMREVQAALEQAGVDFWFGAGTTLGLVREEQGFINHDKDVDLEVVLTPENEKAITQAMETLSCPLVVEGIIQGYLYQRTYLHEPTSILLDFFFYLDEGKPLLLNHNDQGVLIMPKKFLLEKSIVRGFPNPGPVKEYLRERFGDWETPQTSKGDWTKDAGVLFLTWDEVKGVTPS